MKFNKTSSNNLQNVNEETKSKLQNSSTLEKLSLEGIANGVKLDPVPVYNLAPCEKVAISGRNNQQIVVGRDRNSDFYSGYGGKGHSHAGSIDIVVGRKFNETDKKKPVNPNFSTDSARIVISQRTDIDKNFKLEDGTVGSAIARSAIGIKADHVRIIGREGIKLVTKTEDINSLGGPIAETKGIDLIAGNNSKDLQPMVKGKNLVEFLKLIQEDLINITNMINSMSTKQVVLDAALASHTHTLFADPTSPTLLGAYPSATLAVACGINATQTVAVDYVSHAFQIFNETISELDYLTEGSEKYILSEFNNTN